MRYERLAMEMDAGLGARARIGLIVLRTDQTVEHELRQVLARVEGVAAYEARIWNDFEVSRETLHAMQPLIPQTARLLPAEWAFKSIGFACTSASMVIGEAEVARLVGTAHADAAVTNPVSAALAAFKALGVRRPGVLTPYSRSVNEAIAAGLADRGIEVPAMASFEEADDNRAARISAHAVAAAAEQIARSKDVDGVFVSCTSLRTLDVVDKIEAATGKPVTSSNHALIWHMLRLSGIAEPITGLGRLYRIGLAGAAVAG